MTPALLTAVAAALLCFLCVRHHSVHIPADLLSRSREALTAAGIPADGLSFDGRFAMLRGVEGTPAVSVRAKEIVESVWGVHHAAIEAIPAPPEPGAREVQEKLTEMIRLNNVEFETGSANITPEGQAILDDVAGILAKSAGLAVAISGHTDNRGRPEKNLLLSRDRAAAVKTYLLTKGIAAARMTTEGFGQTKPIASNATEEGRRANRRIEFAVKE